MSRKRVSKEEKQQRHEWAMKKIDQGVGFSELASLVAAAKLRRMYFLAPAERDTSHGRPSGRSAASGDEPQGLTSTHTS